MCALHHLRSSGSLALLLLFACSAETPPCGPTEGVVRRVIDGDTVELASGEKVRYLMVDAPETTRGHDDCYGAEARDFNRRLVEGRSVALRYDRECTDRYERLLAYVSVDGREVNSMLVEQGYACVLHIAPNGDGRRAEFDTLERRARLEKAGFWSQCDENPCR